MYKKFVKSGIIIQLIVFLTIAIVLWFPAFISPQAPVKTQFDGPLYTFFYDLLKDYVLISVITAFVFVVISSLLTFYIFNSFFLFGRENLFPAILTVLFFSWNVDYLTLHSVLFAYPFLLWIMFNVFRLYNASQVAAKIFGISFWLGITALIYIPLVYIVLFVWIILLIFRYSEWRFYVVALLSFVLPFVYYVFGLFWNNNILWGYNDFIHHVFKLNFEKNILPVNHTVYLVGYGIISLISLFAALVLMREKHISDKKRSLAVIYFLFTALLCIVLTGFSIQIVTMSFLFIFPFVFGITGVMFIPKRTMVLDVIFSLFLILFFAYRYIWA